MTFRELRKMSGMTQKVFSAYFGIPSRTIEYWDVERSHCSDYLLDLMYYKLVKEGIIKTDKSVDKPQTLRYNTNIEKEK